jgi:endonuclease/exonuclease/phosphatase family metal-dependent hydrolase
MGTLRLVSYNIHGGVGRDRRFSERRVLEVLRELDADVVALQEVDWHPGSGVDMLEWLASELGCRHVAGATVVRAHGGDYGNGLLARCPIHASTLHDLSWRGREPRGAISADVECEGQRLHVVATHLGLRPAERREQVTRLIDLFRQRPGDRGVLLGDLNEWFLWGRPLRRLHRYFEPTPSPPTFPSHLPFLALDRVWTHPRSLLQSLTVHRSAKAREASDHLPLVATLQV